MTTERRLDSAIRAWMAEGPTELSPLILEQALSLIHRTPRARPRWRMGLPTPARTWSLVAAVEFGLLVAAVILAGLLRPLIDRPVLGPGEVPSATVAPSIRPFVLGELVPGTYRSSAFSPAVTLAVPAGFVLRADKSQSLWLATGYDVTAPELDVLRVDAPGTIERLIADEQVSARSPTDVTVAWRPGRSVDIALHVDRPVPRRGEFDADGVMVAALPVDQSYVYLIPGSRARVFELLVGTRWVVVLLQAPASEFDAFARSAETIVGTLSFEE